MAETKYICHLFMFIFEYKITITLERKICMKISGFQAVRFFIVSILIARNWEGTSRDLLPTSHNPLHG